MTASSRPAGREAGRARTRLREVPENFDRRDAWRVVKRAGGLFRPFPGRIFAIALLVLVTSALGLAPVELTRQVVAEGTDLAEQVANGIDRSQLSLWRINLLFMGMIAMYLSSELLGLLRGYLNQMVGQDLTVRLRASLHEHLQRLPVRFYTQTRTGEILARITADVNAVQQAVTGTFTQFMINVTQLGMALCMMFWYDWRFGLIALLVPPLWLYPTLRVGDRMRALQLEWREENAGMTSHLAETLSVAGTMVVRTFGRQEFEASHFQRANPRAAFALVAPVPGRTLVQRSDRTVQLDDRELRVLVRDPRCRARAASRYRHRDRARHAGRGESSRRTAVSREFRQRRWLRSRSFNASSSTSTCRSRSTRSRMRSRW